MSPTSVGPNVLHLGKTTAGQVLAEEQGRVEQRASKASTDVLNLYPAAIFCLARHNRHNGAKSESKEHKGVVAVGLRAISRGGEPSADKRGIQDQHRANAGQQHLQ